MIKELDFAWFAADLRVVPGNFPCENKLILLGQNELSFEGVLYVI